MYALSASQALPGGPVDLSGASPLILYFKETGRVFNTFDQKYIPTEEEMLFLKSSGARQVVPLIEDNNIEGLVVLGDQLAREEFTYEDEDLMKTFARQATLSLMNMRLSEELAETREIAAVARISSFVIHDLKNYASNLGLLLDNAQEHIHNPDFQSDMIETIRNTLKKMETLMWKLKSIPGKPLLNTESADLHNLAQEVVAQFRRRVPAKEILCQGSSAPAVVDVEEIRKVLVNLIMNALDAIEDTGAVIVETGMNSKNIYVRVKDNGCGMSEDFMCSRLFKPFGTTKKKGLGIGLYQSKLIIESHAGRLAADSELGKGTVFTVYLPAAFREP